MKILSISMSHDANLCMYNTDTGWFQYVKLERVNGKKHSEYNADVVDDILQRYDFVDFDHVYTTGIVRDIEKSFVSEYARKDLEKIAVGKIDKVEKWWWAWVESFLKYDFDKITQIDHHYAHMLSSWPLEDITKIDYGVCIDGCGSSGYSQMIVISPADPKKLQLISLGVKGESFGHALKLIGLKMGLYGQTIDMAGKVMGANAYGSVNIDEVENADYWDIYKRIQSYIGEGLKKFPKNVSFKDVAFRDFLSTSHEVWSRSVQTLFYAFVPKDSVVSYSGGCAQNTITNEKLYRTYSDITFVPHCYDGGLSLGCMAYACLDLGIDLPSTKGFPYWQADNIESQPTDAQIKIIAQELANGKIVAWHQGRGEIGPRALGNRSILMNPAMKDGKETLNSKVKHREHWRPYAPSVLREHVQDWFEFDDDSPYMMLAVQVKGDKASKIPSVTHLDGTSRIQTVSQDDNELFYQLLSEFHSLTGIPLLLNTSLNIGGKPIVHSREETLILLETTGIDIVCIGNEIIRG